MGLKKNETKDLKPSWAGVWLSIKFDIRAKNHIYSDNKNTRNQRYVLHQPDLQTGTVPIKMTADVLQTLIGKFSHMNSV